MDNRETNGGIQRSIDVGALCWPTGEERRSETLGGNRDYGAFAVPTWSAVAAMITAERAKVAEIGGAPDPAAAHDAWEEDGCDGGFLLGFDLGTNALSAALRAALCLPFYSCNGGAFGGFHNDGHPVVGAYCRPQVAAILIEAAAEARAGIENARDGAVVAYGRTVDTLLAFAEAVHSRRGAIGRLRRQPGAPPAAPDQMDLFGPAQPRARLRPG